MLKNIPSILSPDLLKYLCEMGHSDKLVIADGNFPVHSMARNAKVIRMDGHGVCEILKAILSLMPLDSYVSKPVKLMEKVKGDDVKVTIWDDFKQILKDNNYDSDLIENVERFKFYDLAKESYLIIATSEKALYANIILQKGVI